MRATRAVEKPPLPRPTSRSFRLVSNSAGLLVYSAAPRTAPTITETSMAAGRPLPATSPTTTSSPPSSFGKDLKEVAADLLCRLIDRIDNETWHCGGLFRHQRSEERRAG